MREASDIVAGMIAAMRQCWDLGDVNDLELAPHVVRVLDAVRSGMSPDVLACDLSDIFIAKLVRPAGNRATIESLAKHLHCMIHDSEARRPREARTGR